jgi:transposase-like protein
VTAARKDKGMGSEVGAGQPACPFCQSTHTELISPFGSQLLMTQHRCHSCQSYFEALREDL